MNMYTINKDSMGEPLNDESLQYPKWNSELPSVEVDIGSVNSDENKATPKIDIDGNIDAFSVTDNQRL
jgi:hypothetical protein